MQVSLLQIVKGWTVLPNNKSLGYKWMMDGWNTLHPFPCTFSSLGTSSHGSHDWEAIGSFVCTCAFMLNNSLETTGKKNYKINLLVGVRSVSRMLVWYYFLQLKYPWVIYKKDPILLIPNRHEYLIVFLFLRSTLFGST